MKKESKKQTAVEWLVEQIDRNPIVIYKEEIYNQAKQMEREQIIDAYVQGANNGIVSMLDATSTPAKNAHKYFETSYSSQT